MYQTILACGRAFLVLQLRDLSEPALRVTEVSVFTSSSLEGGTSKLFIYQRTLWCLCLVCYLKTLEDSRPLWKIAYNCHFLMMKGKFSCLANNWSLITQILLDHLHLQPHCDVQLVSLFV